MAAIRVTCPTCKTELEIDERHAGQEVECGSCLQVFVAKDPNAREEAPAASSTGKRPYKARRDSDEDDEDRPRRKRRSRRDNEYGDYEDDYADRPARRHPPKSRLAYILLGIFLGKLGVHNFYAGRTGPGVAQLVIFLVSWPLMCVYIGLITVFIPYIWAIIDIITVEVDGDGRRMV
jgi:predicted Zn finger-like uncharacterized protein